MDGGHRLSRAARCAVATLVLCLTACGTQSSSDEPAPSPSVSSGTADAAAMREAEATVRAFFAVKGRAEDPFSVRLDKQAAYLTSPDVNPAAAYESSTSDRPSLITDDEVSVELSDMRWVGDEILVDFEFRSTGLSYPMIGDDVQRDDPLAAEGHWDGTATLEQRDDEWLINDLTIVSSGGSIS